MRLTGFQATADGTVLVEFYDVGEDGWYPVSLAEARRLMSALAAATGEAVRAGSTSYDIFHSDCGGWHTVSPAVTRCEVTGETFQVEAETR
jgi:hypothetical protein